MAKDGGRENIFDFPHVVASLNLRPDRPQRILDWGVFATHIPDESKSLIDHLFEMAKEAVRLIATRLWDEERKPKQKVFYVSALRGSIPFETEPGWFPQWVGKRGEYLIPLLAHVFGPKGYIAQRERGTAIRKWAEIFELEDLLGGWESGDNKLRSKYRDPKLQIPLDLISAGHGSRQVMSVVTQLFWGETGDIVMIEEPEISLHPKAQARLPELFAEAIAQGKQVMVTSQLLWSEPLRLDTLG